MNTEDGLDVLFQKLDRVLENEKKKEKNDEASSVYSNSIKFKKSGRKVNEWLYNRTCHITGWLSMIWNY